MPWLDEALDQIVRQPVCGYAPGDAPATEPTALAALALAAHQQAPAAGAASDFLSDIQAADGSVGVRAGETPGWPTSLAVLAWKATACKEAATTGKYAPNIRRAVRWILDARGETVEQSADFGHNTELVGWSYADATHSWIEPTALHVAALKAAGETLSHRTRDGVRLLIDRQLPGGGCNYGNTTVLGQLLRPLVQPTGIALIALAGEDDPSGRTARSVAWLQRAIGPGTTAASLAWALVGLAAHGVSLPQAGDWLGIAHARVMRHDRSPHKLALLALAAKGWPQ
ncbi:MAG: hypothetical protein WD872_16710 [Pirellulaceae bacterium]